VSLALLAASAIVVAGAVACIAGRRAAVVAIGTATMLAGAAFVADPLPAPLLIVERLVGAALAAELLLVGLRGRPPTAAASSLPWPAIALLAAAAFAVGVGVLSALPTGSSDVAGSAPGGVPEALGAALALVVVTICGVARRSDGVQRAVLALPLAAAAGMFEAAFFGEPSALDALIGASIGVAIAGVVAVLATPAPDGPPAGAVRVVPDDDPDLLEPSMDLPPR
jgi:hypothetical protein